MKVLIRLYPRGWRARYGDEMTQVVADQPKTVRLAVDLIAGAIDARLNPQFSAGAREASAGKGETAVTRLLTHCQPHDITTADYRYSVVSMLGTTIALAGLYLALKHAFGDDPFIEAFGVSTFPFAVLVSSWGTYFKRYSMTARLTLIAGLSAIVFVLSLAAESLARAF
jgi:hypothetical protein